MADWDTAAKRYSGLCLGDMLPVTPIPDGTIASGDRQHFLELYSGIAFGAPIPDSGEGGKGNVRASNVRHSGVRNSNLRKSSVR